MSILLRKQSNDLTSLRDVMNRLIENSLFLPQSILDHWTGEGAIPLDMYQENNAIVIKAALPGIKPEDLKIEVRENVLTISGQTKEEVNHKEGDDLLNELPYGQIRRSVTLPCEVKVDQAETEFEDGLLTLILPKVGVIPLKKIAVKPKTKKEEPK